VTAAAQRGVSVVPLVTPDEDGIDLALVDDIDLARELARRCGAACDIAQAARDEALATLDPCGHEPLVAVANGALSKALAYSFAVEMILGRAHEVTANALASVGAAARSAAQLGDHALKMRVLHGWPGRVGADA